MCVCVGGGGLKRRIGKLTTAQPVCVKTLTWAACSLPLPKSLSKMAAMLPRKPAVTEHAQCCFPG